MHTETKFFATAAKGIETLLAQELGDLGLQGIKEGRAGVHFEGDLAAGYLACLWSRLANRILLPVAEFMAADADALYSGIRDIDWSEHMAVEQTLAIDVSVANSALTHSQYVAQRAKDAIVDQFRDRLDQRPSVAPQRPDLQINIYINNDLVKVAIDLSGESLHIRGYRTRGSVAPLKENLAAAILYRARWPEIAREGGGFVDFMCGSGTLPIEAVMIACDIAPGLARSYYGFMGWRQHDESIWRDLKAAANRRRAEGLENPPAVFGFDHHEATLQRTRQHVNQAGFSHIITIGHEDVFTFAEKIPGAGLIALNPPYGKRLGHDEDLEPLYNAIGRVLKNQFLGWQAAVFTDDKSKGKAIGIRANKIHSLYNGALACKLLHFNIVEDEIFKNYRLPKMLADDALSEQSAGFRNRLLKNWRRNTVWSRKNDVSCFRVYDADLPDYSVAIDIYYCRLNDVDSLFVNIQEYQAPKTIDPKKAQLRLREVVTITKDVLELNDENMFLKSRQRQKGAAQYEKLASENNFHITEENNCQFYVNFEDYLDTGLFLDHRPVRRRIAEQSNNKHVLNLFAYTGAISVQAASGGAASILTLDMSKTYLDWARRNMSLNGFNQSQYQFKQVDCLDWLSRPDSNKQYDIIFLDPPSFSNSKRMQQSFDVQRQHGILITQAMALLADAGVLYFSNNLRGFKLDQALLSEFQISNITAETIPQDFKQKKHIHQCWQIQHLS
ncbi:MAG: bifunctional 23S rRNA (guanine(2069)-N(7))-methyltransferase RlmK/23S rRNA (guanine(2445)-N(2))-methyltransferase RlmL [Pseudomonadales bacterium]|nr:bifunctional 23S rRNA (guanine(2069)-N(7))-methyltransferase RlmK/23S rRNA (guanine(2445)-N(2))-methyltransferase RlmL [Pseudomonadales bacterium]